MWCDCNGCTQNEIHGHKDGYTKKKCVSELLTVKVLQFKKIMKGSIEENRKESTLPRCTVPSGIHHNEGGYCLNCMIQLENHKL